VEEVFCVVTLELGTLVWVVVLLCETSVAGSEHAPMHRLPIRIIVEIYAAVVSFPLVITSR
jgi:hypothetical protein